MFPPASKRPALGKFASLGDLYDARTDSFGVSLFNADLPENAVKRADNPSTSMSISKTDTYKEKFKTFDMDSGLSASFLAGLVEVSGSGNFLKETSNSSLSTQMSLIYNTVSVEETLALAAVMDIIAHDRLEDGLATHVVVGITWGAQCVVTTKSEVRHEEKVKEVSAKMEAELLKLKLAGAGAHAGLAVDRGKQDSETKFEVTVHGDIVADDGLVPCDLQSAQQFLSNVGRYMKKANNGKGKPQAYQLMPIGMVGMMRGVMPTKANEQLVELNLQCLENFVLLFDNIHASKMKLHDYHIQVGSHRACVPPEHAREIAEQLGKWNAQEAELKMKYAETLTAVRAGRVQGQELLRLYAEFAGGPFAPENLTTESHIYNEKIEFVDLVEQLGATYIGYERSLKIELMKRSTAGDVYIMYFDDNSMETDEWNGNAALINELLNEKPQKPVLIVDTEAAGLEPTDVRVVHERHGIRVCEDLLEVRRFMTDYCVMRYPGDKLDRSQTTKPNTRRAVKVPCPNLQCQPSETCEWVCFRCRAPIEYGYTDEFLYCDCGRCRYDEWEFRCNSDKHGWVFEKYSTEKFYKLLRCLEPFKELNILILGETGVGKSTWINAFINYLNFASLEEAIAAPDLNFIIPFFFGSHDEAGNWHEINYMLPSVTTVEEVASTQGESATQRTMIHSFHIGDRIVRLIDTPGIGDTRGIEQYKANMEDILQTLTQYPELHGILILLKPNNARLTLTFRFCITELLTHLHRSAARNMAFGFTFTRGSNYRPGDSYSPLKTLLRNCQIDELELSHHTTYSFDSESFRYLASLKQGVELGFRDENAKSWKHSVAQCNRLVEHFSSIPPHQVRSTLSLNQARQVILQLVEPMAKVSQSVADTVRENEADLQRLKNMENQAPTQAELEEMLIVRRKCQVPIDLDRPRAVCTNPDCEQDVDDLEGVSTLYKSVCHDDCTVKFGSLRWCSVMKIKLRSRKYVCKVCNHGLQDHRHITYDLREMTVVEGAEEVAKRLQDSRDTIKPVRELVEEKTRRIEQFKAEQRLIQEACSQFSFFMKENSITPYNDATAAFLREQINEEKRKMNPSSGETERLRRLQESLRQHEKMVGDLKRSLERGEGNEILEENGIEKWLKTLYDLPNFGRDLQKIKEVVDRTREATFREKPHAIRVGAHWPDGSSRRRREFKTSSSAAIPGRVKNRARRLMEKDTT
ncbi:Neoverrucotoxin subunit beta [Madurella mycetomatis]|uniref:Neoverrucotoxin subunit beta n=1 Tax=Madurella mycetomatis TaxID=100816 RepID=A0A175VZV3_9PEZI|nr:Neoverrucotoxin subunit beta [Madurella mycetomatis]